MKLDILAFGAHPDDVEISAGGTLALQQSLGYQCGIVDLTRGDLGTRGTPEIRDREAQAAAVELKVAVRENLGFRDGFFRNDEEHQLAVMRSLRKYRPEIVLANAPRDRHPDHGKAAELVRTASFMAGLSKVETSLDGEIQQAYRPRLVLHYVQFQNLQPDIIIDIGDFIEAKMAAIKAYRSQFYDPNSSEPETVISGKNFLDSIEYRARDMGRLIGCDFGEGFISAQDVGVKDLMSLHSTR